MSTAAAVCLRNGSTKKMSCRTQSVRFCAGLTWPWFACYCVLTSLHRASLGGGCQLGKQGPHVWVSLYSTRRVCMTQSAGIAVVRTSEPVLLQLHCPVHCCGAFTC